MPYLGFFDKMRKSDMFVFLDDVQFEKGGWQNRNRLYGKNGVNYVTLPVVHDFGTMINSIQVTSLKDRKKIGKTIEALYGRKTRPELIDEIKEVLERSSSLRAINLGIIGAFARLLCPDKLMFLSSQIPGKSSEPTQRLIDIVRYMEGSVYLSGEGGKGYLDERLFGLYDIRVEYNEFEPFEYEQKVSPFNPKMSALDYLLCEKGEITWPTKES